MTAFYAYVKRFTKEKLKKSEHLYYSFSFIHLEKISIT